METYYPKCFEFAEFGDYDGGDCGYVIASIDDRKLKIVYDWVWDDNSDPLFRKGYVSGNIRSVAEV